MFYCIYTHMNVCTVVIYKLFKSALQRALAPRKTSGKLFQCRQSCRRCRSCDTQDGHKEQRCIWRPSVKARATKFTRWGRGKGHYHTGPTIRSKLWPGNQLGQ